MLTKFKKKHLLYILVISIITVIVYFSSVNNDFIENWDDNQYILNNNLITSDSGIPIKDIFTEYSMGHYHPITILSYAIEYLFFDLDPTAFHFTNLLLHILNSILVFYFLLQFSKNKWFSLLAALIFSLHPMHVESVAWISSRKDLLYSAFFLLALIFYLKYTATKKIKHLIFVFIAFILSVLSKSAAMILPLILILFDFYYKRITLKTIIEKTPFLAISIIIGLVSINAQKAPIINAPDFSIIDRIFLVFYSIDFYLAKFIIPFKLSAIHYYPEKTDGYLPLLFYLSIIIVIIFIVAYYFFKKNRSILILGIGFFILNILLVIQIFPIGEAFIAERYSYIPYIGLTILLFPLFKENKKITTRISYLIIVILLIFSVQTKLRIEKWNNGITLFSDIIDKYPNQGFAYFNRGLLYLKKGNYNRANDDIETSIELGTNHAKVFFSRGSIKFHFGDYKEAITDNTKAIELDSLYVAAYYNRGLAHAYSGNYNHAILDFDNILKMDSSLHSAYADRANAKYGLGKYEEAIMDFNHFLKIFPTSTKDLYMRGMCYYNLTLNDKACADWNAAANLNYSPAKKAVNANCQN